MFAAWGRFVYRRRWAVLVLSGLLFAGTIAVAAQGGRLEGGGIIETSESGRALEIMREDLPRASGSSFTVLFSSDSMQASDPGFRQALEDALAGIRDDPRVESITTPYDEPALASRYISADGRRALAVVALDDDINDAALYYPELREQISSDQLEVIASGNVAITHDFNVILESDLLRAEIVSFPLALILLLLVFSTVVAALIPLGIGAFAVVGGIAGAFALSQVTEVSQYALNVVTLIGLGVSIDYALFIVNRFREELRRGAGVEDAIARAMSTAGRAIAFSGLTVAIGLSGMLFYQGTFLASMGLAGAVVVGFAVLYGLTFLPALLGVLGPNVDRFRVPLPGSRREGPGAWHALASWVMRRPVLVLVPVLAFAVITASPFSQIRLANGDVNMLPSHAESRRGYDIFISEFPEQDKNQMTVVVAYPGGDPLAADRIGPLHDFVRRVEALPNVLRVESPFAIDPRLLGRDSLSVADFQAIYGIPREQLPEPLRAGLRSSVGSRILALSVLSDEPKLAEAAQQLVRDIRTLPEPPGAEVLVTGLTAFDIDVVELILERTPYAVAWVIAATMVVLFLLLGSVVLPFKAVVMNLISIATSFGAMVFIFQWGNFSEFLGGFTPGPIDPTLPVIMFCTVFGLSMDYEVLLLSRIQEEYARTRDNTHSVAEGLERSGRLITGAAAIMVGVFGAFALAEVVIIKAIGLGMAMAVAIDATLVRALVVPSTMRLLGNLNWWAPGPLARIYRRIAMSESAHGGTAAVAEAP